LIAFLVALEEEARELKRSMVITRTSAFQFCRIFEGKLAGKDVLLVLTGMGKTQAKAATEWILDKYPIVAVISSGFGGALNNKTAVGDIVIYSTLTCDDGHGSTNEKVLCPCSKLIEAATKSGAECEFGVLQGKGISTMQPCFSPESKARLGRESAADVVDMESYWIGQIAAERNLPFIVARSIFDSVKDDLSLLGQVTDGGKVKPFKVLGYLIRHPETTKWLILFSANSRNAGRNLAIFMGKLIKEI
jgi:adenosylhomocysteine nucleosidase